jgi:hypothetical protein
LENGDGVLKLLGLGFVKGAVVDGEIFVFVAVIWFCSISKDLDGGRIPRVTFHKPDVFAQLSGFDAGASGIEIFERFVYFIEHVFKGISPPCIAKAFVEGVVSEDGVSVGGHGLVSYAEVVHKYREY